MPDTNAKLPISTQTLAEKLAQSFGGGEYDIDIADFSVDNVRSNGDRVELSIEVTLMSGQYAEYRSPQYDLVMQPGVNGMFDTLEFNVEIDLNSDTVTCKRVGDAYENYIRGGESSGTWVYISDELVFEDSEFVNGLPLHQCMEAVGMDAESQVQEYKESLEEDGEVFDPADQDFICVMAADLLSHISQLPMELHQYHPGATETFKLSDLQ